MGIFSRISTLFKAEANAAIDKMEDPEKVLNQTIRDMQAQLTEAKTKVAESIAFEKRLKMQYDKAIANAQEWEQKAMMAVNANRDDLATEALGRQQEAQKEADALRAQWEQQKAGCDKIKAKLIRKGHSLANGIYTRLGYVLSYESHLRSGDLLIDIELILIFLVLE